MAKLTLTDVTDNGVDLDTNINANNALIEAAVENTLSRDGTSPNTMSVNIDMNSNKITNLADGVNLQDAVTVNQLTNGAFTIGTLSDVNITSATTGDLIRYDGAEWVNYPDSNYASASHTHELDELDATGITDGWVLTAVGDGTAAWEAATGGGLNNVVEDTTPQLGGNLDVNGNTLTSTANGNVDFNPNGTGQVRARFGHTFRALDGDETSYMQMWHDGTDGRIGTSGDDVNLADGIWKAMRIEDYSVTSTTYTPTGTTQTVDYTAGNAYQLDLESATGNVTITLSNPPSTGIYGEIIIRVEQDSTTPRNLVWPASVKWPGGTAPTISTGANAVDIITLKTWDAGTTWYGDFSQDYS